MEGELVAVEQSTAPHSLKLLKSQEEIAKENSQALQVLHEILDNKKKIVKINGKRHLEIDDWVAIGTAYGLSLKTGDAEPVEIFEAKGFKAKAEIIDRNTGLVIGGAEAYCLDNEQNWLNRDYYQMVSMAQTRAGSKALANQLKGVVALYKSLSGTPAEEMDNISGESKPSKPEPSKPAPKPNKPKVPNTSNMGNKPKAPKAPSKPKLDDEAIEVTPKEVKDTPKTSGMSLKEIIDSNPIIRLAVDELQASGSTPNRDTIKAKLLDLNEMGKVTTDEYKECKALLE